MLPGARERFFARISQLPPVSRLTHFIGELVERETEREPDHGGRDREISLEFQRAANEILETLCREDRVRVVIE